MFRVSTFADVSAPAFVPVPGALVGAGHPEAGGSVPFAGQSVDGSIAEGAADAAAQGPRVSRSACSARRP